MTPLVVGTPEDVAGFALAGIEGVVCTTRGEAERAIADAAADTLLILSPEFAGVLPRERLGAALPARA
ncbi:MAG TPA: V-type ATP synthase subunit F [Thermoanaerobaculia bacterium]